MHTHTHTRPVKEPFTLPSLALASRALSVLPGGDGFTADINLWTSVTVTVTAAPNISEYPSVPEGADAELCAGLCAQLLVCVCVCLCVRINLCGVCKNSRLLVLRCYYVLSLSSFVFPSPQKLVHTLPHTRTLPLLPSFSPNSQMRMWR